MAFPILLPAILGTMILLFGNAFGAFATAQALTGGQINLVTIVIGSQLRGDVLGDPGLGYALALGMVVVMAVAIIGSHNSPTTDRKVVAMRRGRQVWSWFWMILGILYFFLPLLATFLFSLRAQARRLEFHGL